MCHEERDDAGHEGAEHVHIVSGAEVSFRIVFSQPSSSYYVEIHLLHKIDFLTLTSSKYSYFHARLLFIVRVIRNLENTWQAGRWKESVLRTISVQGRHDMTSLMFEVRFLTILGSSFMCLFEDQLLGFRRF
jgi:hypothetical protein